MVNTLNSEIPNARTSTNIIHPNILEVSYSTENVSNDIVDLIRNMNDGEAPTNIITTHATISRNTEVIIREEESNVDEDSVNPHDAEQPLKICVLFWEIR